MVATKFYPYPLEDKDKVLKELCSMVALNFSKFFYIFLYFSLKRTMQYGSCTTSSISSFLQVLVLKELCSMVAFHSITSNNFFIFLLVLKELCSMVAILNGSFITRKRRPVLKELCSMVAQFLSPISEPSNLWS